ncbi:helix-turn-helix transcriptional regulator [Streptomyces montanisoli]|uniref:HTH luxR-type domain-containing protein n=1 Tax=Streptomyces montanisoli TaxID=2798581 RepID=A0A940MD11_9ACTN|nr:LuxR C-terminal-related transcriptional regulator [Streptomyces montanisoli]MBP0460725.1 hypothetical protein [Streptomyces montanisoli]
MIGARHELRAGFVVDRRRWGAVALFRGGGRPDFTPADVDIPRRLSAPIAAALRRTVHRAPADAAPGPGPLAVTMPPAPPADVAEVPLLAYGLTPRERDVLARIVAGLPSRAIATELLITAATMQDHRTT